MFIGTRCNIAIYCVTSLKYIFILLWYSVNYAVTSYFFKEKLSIDLEVWSIHNTFKHSWRFPYMRVEDYVNCNSITNQNDEENAHEKHHIDYLWVRNVTRYYCMPYNELQKKNKQKNKKTKQK